MIKLSYFGSPQFSADFLEKILTDKDLKKNISVEFVVTQPDKPAGRKQILTSTPVKQVAKKHSLKVLEIENLLKIENWKLEISKLDLALVYAYSSIVPKEFLNLPKYGFWCLHPSLLPKYRGPSPIAFALLNGEKETGITIFKMDEIIDHGPIIAQKKLTIKINDYRIDLERKLTDLGFKLFKKVILKLTSWRVSKLKKNKTHQLVTSLTFKPQKHQNATYSRLLKKEDGYIKYETLKKIITNQSLNFDDLPELIKKIYKNKKIFNFSFLIFNFFRSLYPWPGVWTILPNSKRLKIIEMKYNLPTDKLEISRVQLEGKNKVDFKIFTQAYPFFLLKISNFLK